ncbi:hypothetical protein F2Q70_00005162 [Brassica cretica]|uniref:Uncharacterized protein n=1 Tax=Brassica cretica TaxID=69181 RepID=A0A8S9IVW1_BRACR|nr:hypothetical protein F2Q70_00005162 [Brassica cretica]
MEVFYIRKYEKFSLSAICLFLELEAVPGTDTGFSPYFSISSSISRNNLCTQVNRGCSFSAGIPQAGQRSMSSSFGFFVGWNFFFGPKVWSFNDLFRRLLSLKRTSLAFILFHKVSFLAAYSFFREDRPFLFFKACLLLRIFQSIRQYEYFLFPAIEEEKLALPSSFVGGRTRPRHLSTDPFSSLTSIWGEISEADNEAVPMAPLRQRRSYFLDDGPRSEIQ